MSSTHLPEDVNAWPAEPRKVLGVPDDADAKTVRSAYVRLIRVFKPERYPEQFRRVRDAYEYLKLFGGSREEAFDVSEDSASPADVASARRSSAVPGADSHVPDPFAEIRDMLKDGRIDTAYQRLTKLAWETPGGSEDACLRLYWLLRLTPHLDRECDSRDWLAEAMRSSRLSMRSLLLYQRELQRDPADAVHARWNRVLKTEAETVAIGRMLMPRWDALENINRFDCIRQDLGWLRTRYAETDTMFWGRLLLAAVDRLAWDADPVSQKIKESFTEEVYACPELHSDLAAELDRFEMLLQLVEQCRSLSNLQGYPPNFPDALGRLIRLGWNQPFGVVRGPLLHFLIPIAENPSEALAHLDNLCTTHPAVVEVLAGMVGAFDGERSVTEIDSEMQEQIGDYVRKVMTYNDWLNYDQLRFNLLQSCIRWSVAPRMFVEVVVKALDLGESDAEGLRGRTARDPVMHIVCCASRSLWN